MILLPNNEYIDPRSVTFIGDVQVDIDHNLQGGNKKYWFPVICAGCLVRMVPSNHSLDGAVKLRAEILTAIKGPDGI